MSRLRPKLTYSNVVASIALFAALGGGVAWAHGKIGTKDLRNNAVTTPKLRNNAVAAKNIRPNHVRPRQVRDLRWRNLELENGWEPSGSGAPQVAKDAEGMVHLRGRVAKSDNETGDITTLPPRFRPSIDRYVATACVTLAPATTGALIIDSNGEVAVNTGWHDLGEDVDPCRSAGVTSLDGVSFSR